VYLLRARLVDAHTCLAGLFETQSLALQGNNLLHSAYTHYVLRYDGYARIDVRTRRVWGWYARDTFQAQVSG